MKKDKPVMIIVKSALDSKQIIDKDKLTEFGSIIEPFVDFDSLLEFFYYNVYHNRCIKLKANILSNIIETDLDKYLPPEINPKAFLYSFILNLELFGNAFIERAGTKSSFYLYIIPTQEARVNINREIYQSLSFGKYYKLDGFHFYYFSPRSRFYGEPDYLSILEQIITTQYADKYNTKFFENSAMPDFAIIFENTEPTEEQIEAFRQFFGSHFRGYENAHKTLILSSGQKEDISNERIRLEKLHDVKDISFKDLKNTTRDEIISAHGVPPRLVGVVQSGHLGGGSELISQLHMFNETTIKPKMEAIEYFFENIGIKLKLKPLDISSFKDDSSIVENLVNARIISIEEARQILGYS